MFDITIKVFMSLFGFLKYPIYIIVGIIVFFYILVFINIFIGLIKGKRFKKGYHKKLKKKGILRRILIDLPKQFVNDMFEKDPSFFKYQGMIIFERSSRKWKNNIYD